MAELNINQNPYASAMGTQGSFAQFAGLSQTSVQATSTTANEQQPQVSAQTANSANAFQPQLSTVATGLNNVYQQQFSSQNTSAVASAYTGYQSQGVEPSQQASQVFTPNVGFVLSFEDQEMTFNPSNLGYIADSGVYNVDITGVSLVDSTRNSMPVQQLHIVGIATRKDDPNYIGRFSTYLSLPDQNVPTTLYDQPALNAFIIAAGAYTVQPNGSLTPDLSYREVSTSDSIIRELPQFKDKKVVIVFIAANRTNSKGIPYINIKDVFDAYDRSPMEISKNQPATRIKNYLDPTSRFYLASQGRGVMFEQAQKTQSPQGSYYGSSQAGNTSQGYSKNPYGGSTTNAGQFGSQHIQNAGVKTTPYRPQPFGGTRADQMSY